MKIDSLSVCLCAGKEAKKTKNHEQTLSTSERVEMSRFRAVPMRCHCLCKHAVVRKEFNSEAALSGSGDHLTPKPWLVSLLVLSILPRGFARYYFLTSVNDPISMLAKQIVWFFVGYCENK